jgi:hypothetical protein
MRHRWADRHAFRDLGETRLVVRAPKPRCGRQEPELTKVDDRLVACHLYA